MKTHVSATARKGRRPNTRRTVNTAISYTEPCFLASATWQRAQYLSYAAGYLKSGNQQHALVYDAYAEIVSSVEDEIRQGAAGPVNIIMTWDAYVR